MTTDVVIPYYDAPERLASILLALGAQRDPRTGGALRDLSIVVADDASNVPPDVSMSTHPARVVRHDVTGYHAATTRNVGVAAGTSPIVVLLDGDTVPDPWALARLVDPIERGEADLTTGRRAHGDLDGLGPAEVAAWVAAPTAERRLPEPAWLREGLERTDRLRVGTSQVYQYVISAVMAVRRDLFEEVGGFDDRFDTYGGEDWELAYRCWNAGAAFLHVPDALAFHDGPDVEGRAPDPTAKTIESLRILDRVPASATRPGGIVHEVPDLDVELALLAGDPVANAVGLTSLLADPRGDLRVRLTGADADRRLLLDHVHDPRVVRDPTPPPVAARAEVVLPRPVTIAPGALGRLAADVLDGRVAERRARLDPPDGADPVEVVVRSRRLATARWRSRAGTTGHAERHVELGALVVDGAALGIEAVAASDLAGWLRRQNR